MGANDDGNIFVDVIVIVVVLIIAGGCEASAVVVRSVSVVLVVTVDDGVLVVVEVPGTVFVCKCPAVSAVVAVALPVLVMEPEFAD